MLHNRVKLQQSWHRAFILTSFPALIFFFCPPPPPRLCGEQTFTFLLAKSKTCHIFSLLTEIIHRLPWRRYIKPIFALRFEGKVPAAVWKSDVIRHITAGVSNWACGQIHDTGGWGGFVGNMRMEKGLQTQYRPPKCSPPSL